MSRNFTLIKSNYDKGFYSKAMVKRLVGKRLGITAAEYELITGDPYSA